MSALDGIEVLEFNVFKRGSTELLAVNRSGLNTETLERVFFLIAAAPDQRGAHAHKACTQWFSLLSGSASLVVSDGIIQKEIVLSGLGINIKIPPRIWVEVNIFEPSVIAVFTDYDFDESDYIRDWDSFLELNGEV